MHDLEREIFGGACSNERTVYNDSWLRRSPVNRGLISSKNAVSNTITTRDVIYIPVVREEYLYQITAHRIQAIERECAVASFIGLSKRAEKGIELCNSVCVHIIGLGQHI